MKNLAKFGAACGLAVLAVGCAQPGDIGATPGYSAHQNGQRIVLNWDYEGKQAVDDWDDFWLLTPASKMTIWNVRTSEP